jgi:hypothetical protein
MLFIKTSNCTQIIAVQYNPSMLMGHFLGEEIANMYALEKREREQTVLAKLHTPDLRVVFNGENSRQQMRALIQDWTLLILSPWPEDGITRKSLMGNAAVAL